MVFSGNFASIKGQETGISRISEQLSQSYATNDKSNAFFRRTISLYHYVLIHTSIAIQALFDKHEDGLYISVHHHISKHHTVSLVYFEE